MSKNNFKPCHHIEFNTLNPNPILKITISFTKTPNKSKYFIFFENKKWKSSKIQNLQKLKFLFGIMYTFHNSFGPPIGCVAAAVPIKDIAKQMRHGPKIFMNIWRGDARRWCARTSDHDESQRRATRVTAPGLRRLRAEAAALIIVY